MVKAAIVGRPLRGDRPRETLLPKRLALAIFARDPLWSVTYATRRSAGAVPGWALYLAPWIALTVVVLPAVVVMSYRQVVRAYPTGAIGARAIVTPDSHDKGVRSSSRG